LKALCTGQSQEGVCISLAASVVGSNHLQLILFI
jgi:hypothetical protein